MLMFCQRFGTTTPRRAILRGLLELREVLRGAGITDGCQWLDGSFVEDVERLRNRAPNDIDVVTLAVLGDAAAQRALLRTAPALIGHECKQRFHVDHYILPADRGLDEKYARRVGYWYSMWSRQRDTDRWKGFVSVSLASNDADASAWLDQQDAAGVGAP
jgi:hypothetical protein